MDINIPPERSVQGKEYRCNDCGERFKGVGRKPICPSCQSDNLSDA
jgi:rubrerythrin